MTPVNVLRKLFDIFQVFRLRNSIETRTEKVYVFYRDSLSRHLSRLSIIHLMIYIGKSKLARAGIEYFL